MASVSTSWGGMGEGTPRTARSTTQITDLTARHSETLFLLVRHLAQILFFRPESACPNLRESEDFRSTQPPVGNPSLLIHAIGAISGCQGELGALSQR